MQPAFTVIFLTTLIGAGQGLFLALFVQQIAAWMELSSNISDSEFHLQGSVLVLILLAAGLFASFFHLGHPERAWRSATRWRTSWLSREVIALPLFMGLVVCYAAVWFFRPDENTGAVLDRAFWIGCAAAAVCLCLFICTGMIYACLRFLQHWSTLLTVINFMLLGTASGFMLATAVSVTLLPTIKALFLLLVFPIPLVLLWLGLNANFAILLSVAAATHYLGLLMERWNFFAEASHPQNLYYQAT